MDRALHRGAIGSVGRSEGGPTDWVEWNPFESTSGEMNGGHGTPAMVIMAPLLALWDVARASRP